MTEKVRCRHRRCWVVGNWLWCYECGALRNTQKVELSNLMVASGKWIKPVGIGGDNPALKMLDAGG